jgi:hypothetical protein
MIGQHDMAGPGDTRTARRRILRREEIMAANPGEAAVDEVAHQVINPVVIRAAVGVGERNNLSRRRRDACVARPTSMIGLADVTQFRKARPAREYCRSNRRPRG